MVLKTKNVGGKLWHKCVLLLVNSIYSFCHSIEIQALVWIKRYHTKWIVSNLLIGWINPRCRKVMSRLNYNIPPKPSNYWLLRVPIILSAANFAALASLAIQPEFFQAFLIRNLWSTWNWIDCQRCSTVLLIQYLSQVFVWRTGYSTENYFLLSNRQFYFHFISYFNLCYLWSNRVYFKFIAIYCWKFFAGWITKFSRMLSQCYISW